MMESKPVFATSSRSAAVASAGICSGARARATVLPARSSARYQRSALGMPTYRGAGGRTACWIESGGPPAASSS